MTALSIPLLITAVPAAANAATQAAKPADPPSKASAKRPLARRLGAVSGPASSSSGTVMTALPSVRQAIRLAAAGPVQASPASPGGDTGGPAPQLQEVVVTGFRQSLESALNAQRVAVQPIEAVAEEDLGKMPDQNVAESLQRLPGVQINRAVGFGTQVLVEGLSQNVIELNGDDFLTGREFYTSGEAANGGAGANFQYSSLESIPSEEVSGIDVELNPTAADLTGAIGGTIDLKTQDPLAMPLGLTLAGNARGVDSEGAGGITPNASLVAAYKFNSRFALEGSISYDKYNT
ncbi:MAG: TonB-dependent receptor plug domain-containing protein, partial [Terriglobales bacterium]